LALIQLQKLPNGNRRRMSITNRYKENFANSSIFMPFSKMPHNYESAYHILPVLLPKNSNRKDVINFLKSNGIQSSIHYPPFWGFTAYKGLFTSTDTPIASRICEYQLTLPLFPTMTNEEVDKVTSVLLNAIS